MKLKYLFIAAIPFLLLLVCCKSYEPLGIGSFSKSYIQVYKDADSLLFNVVNYVNTIQIGFLGDDITGRDSRFTALTEHFNDTYFNRKLGHFQNRAIANEFTGVEIVSDGDFNGIAAGESLRSVTKIISASAFEYIWGGYENPYDWRTKPDEYRYGWGFEGGITNSGGYYPVLNTLDKLVPDDMKLLDPTMIYLRFTEIPQIKEHTFTVTFREGEKEITASTAFTFVE